MSVYQPKTIAEPKAPPVPFTTATVTPSDIAEATARAERAEKERDRFEAALGRVCLVGGTTYLIERAERAETELAELRAEMLKDQRRLNAAAWRRRWWQARVKDAETEVTRLSKINVDICRNFNTLRIDGARLEDRIRDLEIALRNLHKAATQVSKLGAITGPQWSKLTIELLKSSETLTAVPRKAMGGAADESEGFP